MSRQFKLSFMDRILTFPGSYGHLSYDTGENKITYLETENGSISGDKEWALPDEVVTLSNTPDQDYIIDEYYVNGSAISGNTFLMPNEDVDVSATFKQAWYNIIYTSDGHGTVNGNKASAYPEETVTLTNSPNNGYKFDKYYVNGVGQTSNTFSMPAQDTTVSGSFLPTSGQLYGNAGSNTPGAGSTSTWIPDTSVTSGNFIALKFTYRRTGSTLGSTNWSGPIIRANNADKLYSQGVNAAYGYRIFMNSGANFSFTITAGQKSVYSSSRRMFYDGTAYSTDAVGKLIFNRSNGSTSAFLNGTYWGYQNIGTKINSVGLKCNNVTVGSNSSKWVGSKFYLAWFDNFNDAKKY